MTTVITRLPTLLKRPASVMGAGRLGVAVLGLAATPILTRELSASEYGTFALFVAVASIASTIPIQWLVSATLRFGGTVEPSELRATIVRGTLWSAIPVVVIAVLGTLLTLPLTPFFLISVAAYSVLEAFYNAFWMGKRTQLAAWTFTLAGVVRNGIPLAVFGVLITFRGLTLESVVLAMAAASFLGSVAMWRLSVSGVRDPARRPTAELGGWFRFGRPLIANYAFGLALIHANRFILLAVVGVEAVGMFAPTYDLIVTAVTLLSALVGLVAVPQIFAASEDDVRRVLLRRLRIRVCLTVGAVAVAIGLTWPLVSRILIGDSLRIDSPAVVFMLAASAALMAYRFQYLNIRLQLLLATRVQTVATLVGLVVNVLLGLALIPSFEIVGAAVTTLVASVLANAWITLWLWRNAGKESDAPRD